MIVIRYCLAFSSVVRKQWDMLKAFTAVQRFERNQVIYAMGDSPDAMYLIESGLVKVVQFSADGKEKITGICQKGDLFGEICFCEKGARENQAVALEPVSLISFRMSQLMDVLQKNPELTVKLLMVFCARLVECHTQIASLAFDEVRERLGKEILRLSLLLGGHPEKGGVQLPASLTHQQLANLVNTTRENVTMVMNQFRRWGLVEYRRGKILVFPPKIKEHLS